MLKFYILPTWYQLVVCSDRYLIDVLARALDEGQRGEVKVLDCHPVEHRAGLHLRARLVAARWEAADLLVVPT